ncbi:S8/S53 family peptidase [Spirosoma aerolatum]|uniref:hypothetical protein n=1 Tax=Spirosoma aerolatum TaxID=1211326 RepID=UPI0009ADF244|nr:hypothetical protein [Spirosoma aerolatum]
MEMNLTINLGDYILFPEASDTLKKLYLQGDVLTYHPKIVAGIFDFQPANAQDDPGWVWAFDDHAEVIADNVPKDDQKMFGCLMCRIGKTVSYMKVAPDFEGFRYAQLGLSGNGNQDWLATGHFSKNDLFQKPMPQALQPSVKLLPDNIIGRQRPVVYSNLLRKASRQRLVHLCRPIASAPGSVEFIMETWAKQQGSVEALFTFLDSLPSDFVNQHAKDSLRVAKAATAMSDDSLSTAYVSLDYPSKLRIYKEGFYGANVRFNMAFSSPVVLSLTKGDVLFISESATYEEIKFPAIYDMAVFLITRWLEAKEVTVLFSAGGSKRVRNNIDDRLARLATKYGITNWPGIIVGGVDNDGKQFQSNYGTAVTCYAKPPAENFDESSGATASIAGLAMRAQAYARSRGRFLRPMELKQLLRSAGQQVSILENNVGYSASLPNWTLIQKAIDQLNFSTSTL